MFFIFSYLIVGAHIFREGDFKVYIGIKTESPSFLFKNFIFERERDKGRQRHRDSERDRDRNTDVDMKMRTLCEPKFQITVWQRGFSNEFKLN